MNWKFWIKPEAAGGQAGNKNHKLAKPQDLPEAVGRKMVVSLKIDPDVVWALKYVSRPFEDQRGVFEFRLFNPENAIQSGVVVKNWQSLDDRPDLILYEGRYSKYAREVDLKETCRC
jgi:hypothetical protein